MTTRLLIARSLAFAICSFAPKGLAQTTITYIDIRDGSAYENAAAATVIVERGGNTNTVVTVDYATKDGTAKAGVDYTTVSGTLTFTAEETKKTISIPLSADDGVVGGDKIFRVFITNATRGAVIETGEGIVTIQDNEVPANLDYSFDPIIDGIDGAVHDLAALSDGKILIAGSFTSVNGVKRLGLACLIADGSLVAAFQTQLLYAGQPGGVSQVQPLPDGRVYVAGGFDSVNGVERPGFARLLPDGTLDPSFAPTNVNYIYSWEIVQTDGKIIAQTLRDGLVRLNLDGSRDNSFVTTLLRNWNIYDIAEHTDGKLLVSGDDGHTYGIIRLNRDGTLDSSFGPGPAYAWKLFVQPDQKILVAGTFYNNNFPTTTLERLNADGSLDTSFAVSVAIDPLSISGASLEASGKIIVWSGFTRGWRLNPDGSLATSFPGVQLEKHEDLGLGWAEIKSFDTVAYVYGNFLIINGAAAHGLNRILLDAPPRTGIDIQFANIFYFASRAYLQTIGENDGSVAVSVRRLGQTTDPATVAYSTRDGTAKAGHDYIATSGMLSFAPLEVEKIVTVPILDNAAFDGRRTFQLFLTNAVGTDFIAPPLTMTILDDEVGFEPGTIKRLADGSVRMIVQVLPWRTWDLEVSSDLQTWVSATFVDWNYASPFETELIGHGAASFPRRFYRVRAE